jgi:hypothetical protein
MYLTPSFLIPALIIAFIEIAFLVAAYLGLKGRTSAPAAAPVEFLWKLDIERKFFRIIFPVALIVALIGDVTALRAYTKYSNEQQAATEITEALKPILANAVSIKRDAICTRNGYIAGERTLESDKIACAQVGDFRVLNPSLDRSSVMVFKARSETEVVQVIRNGYEAITLIDGETTVDQLKTAFLAK